MRRGIHALLALIAVLAVAAAIGWWPARERVIEPGIVPPNAPIEAARDGMGEELTTPRPAETRAPLALRSDVSAGSRADDAPLAPLPPRVDPNATPGRIVLRDASGAEVAAGSGTLRGTWVDGPGVFSVDSIAVVAGRFSVVIPGRRALEVRGLELDGQRLPIETARIRPDANGELVVEARYTKPLLLHARDAATQAELRDVTVIRCWKLAIGPHAHSAVPSSDSRVAYFEETLVRGGVSPVAIGVPSDKERLHWRARLCVGAPGYAWSTQEVDFALGGDAAFELAQGGSIEVALAGDLSLAKASGELTDESRWDAPILRVWRLEAEEPDAEPFDVDVALADMKETIASATEGELAEWFEDGRVPDDAALRAKLVEEHEREAVELAEMASWWPVAEVAPSLDGPTRIDGLLPGRHAVSLERGSDWSNALVFARAETLVAAGSTTRVTLVAAPVVRPQEAPFSGRLRLAPAWEADRIDLRCVMLEVPGSSRDDEFQLRLEISAASGSEWHPFDAGPRRPGRWLVHAYDYGFQQIVDTGPAGRADVEIAIGDPCDVAIRLIDAASGAPIVSDVSEPVRWWCVPPDSGSTGGIGETKWSAREACYCCRAPAGEIELMLDTEVTRLHDGVRRQRLRVAPGANEVRFVLRRMQALELRFEVDGRPPVDWFDRFASAEIELQSIATGKRRQQVDSDWGESMWFRLPEPGRWRVVVPRIPGYRPIEPFEVDIAALQATVHRVALVRDDG